MAARRRIPALAMLALGEVELGARARALAELAGPRARVIESAGRPGGGTLPLTELPGPVCEIDPGAEGAERLAARLRADRPPIIARIAEGRVVLDPRTLLEGQVERGRRDRGAAPCLIRAPLPAASGWCSAPPATSITARPR